MKKIAIILIAVFLLCLTSCDFEALAELASLSINSSSNLSNSVAYELAGTSWKCSAYDSYLKDYYYMKISFSSKSSYYTTTNHPIVAGVSGSWYLSDITSSALTNGDTKYTGYIYLKEYGGSSYSSKKFSYYPNSGYIYIGGYQYYKD